MYVKANILGGVMKKVFIVVIGVSFGVVICLASGDISSEKDHIAQLKNKEAVESIFKNLFYTAYPDKPGDPEYKTALRALGAPKKYFDNVNTGDLQNLDALLDKYAARAYRHHRGIGRNVFHMPRWQHALAGLGFTGLTIGGYYFMGKAAQKLNWVALERHVLRQRLLEQFGHADHKMLREKLRDKLNPLTDNLQIVTSRYLEVDKEFKKLNAKWYASLAAFLIGGIGTVTTGVKHYRSVPTDQWRAQALL